MNKYLKKMNNETHEKDVKVIIGDVIEDAMNQAYNSAINNVVVIIETYFVGPLFRGELNVAELTQKIESLKK
jgi:hypothetical protein